jgi:YYY domain-containing protein
MNELILAIKFYAAFSILGTVGFFFVRKISDSFSVTYVLSKFIGLLVLAYPLWLGASLKIFSFNSPGVVAAFFTVFVLAGACYLAQRASQQDKIPWRRMLVVEGSLFLLFAAYLYVRSFNSGITWGSSEKFMDLMMLSGAGKTAYFPFADGWNALLPVNYYYYGYYLFALLANLAHVPYATAFNLALGLIFSLSAVLAVLIVYRITFSRIFAAMGAAMALLGGTLIYAICVYQNWGEALGRMCFYPMITRAADYVITEIPVYSFLIGDLHPHLMGLPFLLAAILLAVEFWRSSSVTRRLVFACLIVFATAAVVNTWDFITSGLVLGALVLLKVFFGRGDKAPGGEMRPNYKKTSSKTLLANDISKFRQLLSFLRKKKFYLLFLALVASSPFILYLPFFVYFHSPMTGIGFSPAYVAAHHLAGTVMYPSNFKFLGGIWGAFALVILVSLAFLKTSSQKIGISLAFAAISVVLITFSEFFFFEDLFHVANPSFFRANTVFKLGYHAWILLSFASASLLAAAWRHVKAILSKGARIGAYAFFTALTAIFAVVIFAYPAVAFRQMYAFDWPWSAGFGRATLDGSKAIADNSATDYATIQWLNANVNGRAVVVEAAGGSYSYNGRIAAFSGMENPINWETHEWTHRFHYPPGVKNWRDALDKQVETGYGDIGAKVADVRRMYETSDVGELRQLLAKYGVKYIYIGDFERTTYPGLDVSKFYKVADVVFTYGNSALLKVK